MSFLLEPERQRSVCDVRNKRVTPRTPTGKEQATMNTYATPAPITATFDVPAGRVQVIAADRSDTTVEVRPADPAKNRDAKAAEQVTVEFADGTLQVRAATGHRYLGPSGAVEVTVRLPAGSRVEGTAAATEFRGVGRLGEVVFDGAYRHIKIDEAAGVRLTATDGDVEVGHLDGPADISTQRGDIRITRAAGGRVDLRTRSGDVSVGAAPGVSAALDARTSYGRVTNDLKNDGTTGLDVRATTDRGDITARSL
jgi:Putative adhesin